LSIAREEIFGPVLVASPYDTLEEVARRANDTEYGLAAGVWTNDLSTSQQMVRRLEAGTVWVNTYMINEASVPFGGYKLSGYGREYGPESIDQYTQIKSVWHSLAPRGGEAP
jgi:aldehyde dehydrogenase (NAD+)